MPWLPPDHAKLLTVRHGLTRCYIGRKSLFTPLDFDLRACYTLDR